MWLAQLIPTPGSWHASGQSKAWRRGSGAGRQAELEHIHCWLLRSGCLSGALCLPKLFWPRQQRRLW